MVKNLRFKKWVGIDHFSLASYCYKSKETRETEDSDIEIILIHTFSRAI